ncbi:serine hydrolase, partial [Streptomyces sp. NPDC056295]
MRRTSPRRLLAATLLAASVLAPLGTAPAKVVTTPHAPATAAGPHGDGDCPTGGFGSELTARLDKTVEDVRRQARVPGLVVGLWMPGKGCYVRATGVADKATGRPMFADTYVRI